MVLMHGFFCAHMTDKRRTIRGGYTVRFFKTALFLSRRFGRNTNSALSFNEKLTGCGKNFPGGFQICHLKNKNLPMAKLYFAIYQT